MRNVLIVGAGDRIKNTIIPTFYCLRHQFRVMAVMSRTKKKLLVARGREEITTETDWSEVDLEKIDLVVVAVSLEEVPKVLQTLLFWGMGQITVLLDTPVFAYYHFSKLNLLKKFSKVYLSEEIFFLPPIKLAKKLVDKGAIGEIKSIEFSHFSYKYHALAVIKYLCGRETIKWIWFKKGPGNQSEYSIFLSSAISATLSEPQEFDSGYFKIAGEKGIITNSKYDNNAKYKITCQTKNGIYRGLSINDKLVSKNVIDRLYLKGVDLCFFDKNLMKSMKIRAFMDLLETINRPKSIINYPPIVGFVDQIIMAAAERIGFFFDFSLSGRSGFTQTLKFFSSHFLA